MMVYLTRVAHFNAAHRLYNKDWSEAKNREVFGKCANQNWHGHNYTLQVTVKGNPHPETGFIFNAKTLGDIVEDVIIEKVDHLNLNIDVEFMKGKFASVENLVIGIWDELKPHLDLLNVELYKLKLEETHNIFVEYYGEK